MCVCLFACSLACLFVLEIFNVPCFCAFVATVHTLDLELEHWHLTRTAGAAYFHIFVKFRGVKHLNIPFWCFLIMSCHPHFFFFHPASFVPRNGRLFPADWRQKLGPCRDFPGMAAAFRSQSHDGSMVLEYESQDLPHFYDPG